MSDNELLLAISNMIQAQLQPIHKKIDQSNQEIHEVKLFFPLQHVSSGADLAHFSPEFVKKCFSATLFV
ncbi:MAG: hypothetical protein HFI39_12515 [Lachnospiraceae bacterium]|nr:hypothetical protein [Lachnospiraceae bacterium]